MNSLDTNNPMPPHSRVSASIDSRIDSAIEHKPEIEIPADFAAKVAALAATQPLRRRRYKPQFGPMIALLSAPLAALALFVLAPHSSPNLKSLSYDTEVVLLAELAIIGWWLARTFNPQTKR